MRNQWVWVVFTAAAGVLVGGRAAWAVGVASDSFDYPAPGGLVGKSGGTGFGGSWAAVSGQADPALAAGSLDYSDGSRSLQTSGNKVAPANTSRATRNLDAAEVVAGRVIWIGFRENFTGAGAMPTNHAGFSIFGAADGGTPELFMGKPGSATNWGVDTSDQNAAQATGAVSEADKNAFLLTKLDYTVSPAAVSMWVNPPLDESMLGTPDVTSTQGHFNIVSVRVSTGANSVGYEFDEFRMGDTFADVVPEPAASGAALAAAGLLALRRRRA